MLRAATRAVLRASAASRWWRGRPSGRCQCRRAGAAAGGGVAAGWSLFGIGPGGGEREKTREEVQEEDAERLRDSIRAGMAAARSGDLDRAETVLHAALKAAQDMRSDEGVTYIFDQLANVAYQRGDYMKAERLFVETLRRHLASFESEAEREAAGESNEAVAISLKLASIYDSWDQKEKAGNGYRFCVRAQEKKLSSGHLDEDTVALWGMANDYHAQFLLKSKMHKEALAAFEAAFGTAKGLFGERHPQTLVLMNSMGTVCSLMGDQESAVAHFERAARLAEEIGCENRGAYLVNLGMARIGQGMVEEAKECCTRGYMAGKERDDEELMNEAKECIRTAKKVGGVGR